MTTNEENNNGGNNNNEEIEVEISSDTIVAELKMALADTHNIPNSERRRYGIFVKRAVKSPQYVSLCLSFFFSFLSFFFLFLLYPFIHLFIY